MPSVVLISCGETVAQLGAFAFAAGMTTNVTPRTAASAFRMAGGYFCSRPTR
jgi:hypothetical protein